MTGVRNQGLNEQFDNAITWAGRQFEYYEGMTDKEGRKIHKLSDLLGIKQPQRKKGKRGGARPSLNIPGVAIRTSGPED